MHDLEAQLRSYGDAVELTRGPMRTQLLDVESSADDIVAPADPTGTDRPHRRPRLLAGVLTIAVVLAGAGAITALGTTADNTSGVGDLDVTSDTKGAAPGETVRLAADPLDPTAPLYVLPTTGSGVEVPGGPDVENGSVTRTTNPADWTPLYYVVLGTPSADGFRDLVSVRLGVGLPPISRGNPGNAARTQVDAPSGLAEVELSGPVAVVTQQRRDMWLRVMAPRDRADAAVALLTDITVNGDNTIGLGDTAPMQILNAGPLISRSMHALTSFNVSLVERGETLTVETGSSPSTLGSAVALGGTTSLVSVNGLEAWRVTRQDVEGEWNAVSWRATPGYSIAVSGIASLDEIIKVAESLEIVDETTWRAALPQAVELDQ